MILKSFYPLDSEQLNPKKFASKCNHIIGSSMLTRIWAYFLVMIFTVFDDIVMNLVRERLIVRFSYHISNMLVFICNQAWSLLVFKCISLPDIWFQAPSQCKVLGYSPHAIPSSIYVPKGLARPLRTGPEDVKSVRIFP